MEPAREWIQNISATQAADREVYALFTWLKQEYRAPLGDRKKRASGSYRQRPGSSASSASAPRRWSQTTGPPFHSARASSSRSSASRRPPSPHPGSIATRRKSRGLLSYLPLRPRGHRCWRGAHVWEPLVNQLILNGKHLTALLGWKASDQPAPGSDKQGSALHEPAGGCEGRRGNKEALVFSFCASGCVSFCVRAWSLMSLLRPQGALHICWQLCQCTDTDPEINRSSLQNKTACTLYTRAILQATTFSDFSFFFFF